MAIVHRKKPRRRKKSQREITAQNFLKGRLFELFVEEIVKRAGFETDRDKVKIKQLTTRETLKGRGGTYRPDVLGLFNAPVPFSYPLLLVGECKNYKGEVGLKDAREFLGCSLDLQQYNHISFRRNELKFSQLFKQERYHYLPVLFSLQGFQKNPQVLLYTHGIGFVSYESLPIAKDLSNIIESIIKKLDVTYSKLNEDISKIESITDLSKRRKMWKKKPRQEIALLKTLLSKNSSRIGVLDRLLTLHIIVPKKKRKEHVSTQLKQIDVWYQDKYFTMRKRNRHIVGYFSISPELLKEYLKNRREEAFKDLTIYNISDNLLFPSYYRISDTSRESLFKQVLKAGSTNAS